MLFLRKKLWQQLIILQILKVLTGIALLILAVFAAISYLVWRRKKLKRSPSLFRHILQQDRFVVNADYNEGGTSHGRQDELLVTDISNTSLSKYDCLIPP